MAFCPCCCKSKSDRWRMTCFTVLSSVLVVFGIALYFIYRAVFTSVVLKQSDLREGSLLYPEWVEPSQILDVGFFMMNITNAEEFESQTAENPVAPIFETKGPYVYRVSIKKDGLRPLDTTPKEIAFRQTFKFYYMPDLTIGSKDDMITTINFFALGLGPTIEYLLSRPEASNIDPRQKAAIYAGLNAAIRRTNSKLTLRYPAGEILFGLRDPLYSELIGVVNSALQNTSLAPYLPIDEEFGFFKILNGSNGWHDYQTYTGDPEDWLTNIITTLDRKKSLTYWFGDSCNMINGSDGTVTPPFRTREELVYHLYPSACRSTYVKYVKDTTVKRLPAWEYRAPPEMFKAPSNSDYNNCFCRKNSSELYCTHDGGLYMGPCTLGIPLYISAPHFLHSDGYFRSLVKGMGPPDEETHGTVYMYEPNIGAAISAKKKLQFNLYVTPNDNIAISRRISEPYVFPIFWLNGTYEVNQDEADLLYGLIVVSEIVVICLQVVVLLIGTLLLYYIICSYRKRNVTGSTYSEEDSKDFDETDIGQEDLETRAYWNDTFRTEL